MAKAKKTDSRNRSKLAREAGRRLVSFEISAEADGLIAAAADALSTEYACCTRLAALESLIREGAKKILEKRRTLTGLVRTLQWRCKVDRGISRQQPGPRRPLTSPEAGRGGRVGRWRGQR